MCFILDKNIPAQIYIAEGERENVLLAAEDLIKDIKRVYGKSEITENLSSANVIVCSAQSKEFCSFSHNSFTFSHQEEYRYIVENDKIYLFGADDLGTMWSIYSFCENELNIPPYYYFDDVKISRRSHIKIENKTVTDYPRTKFRGWFINDEDLLGGFKSKGKRDIDYIFYKDIIHPDLMEKIVETALRFKINLIIPSTLIDIHNPTEENLVKIVSKRGLFVSQHHIEPMGVSHFAFEKFAKKFGYDNTQSFIGNKTAMVACWKYYAEKWAQYQRVVWQLGLRGAGDKPVWATDKSVGENIQARGKLISDAIAAQYDIISSSVNGEIYSTSTVWMEGAKLLQSGNLILPEKTIPIFADIGISQLFGDDFFTVPREENRKYGIYYHSQYWHVGSHLSEGVYPDKIAYVYNLARENKSDYYAVLNVGNIREFTFSININAKLMWGGDNKPLCDILDEYCDTYARGYKKELKTAILAYYNALGELDEKYYKNFCDKYDFNYHKYTGLLFPVLNINDGIICYLGKRYSFEEKREMYSESFGKTVENSFVKMKKASRRFELIKEKVSKGYITAFIKRWCYQAEYWVNLLGFALENCKAIEDYNNGRGNTKARRYSQAGKYIKNILDLRQELFTGKWKKWFSADFKLNINKLYEVCLAESKK